MTTPHHCPWCLADDLVDAWHEGDDPRPLHEFMRLSREEGDRWAASNDLPDDFEERHR